MKILKTHQTVRIIIFSVYWLDISRIKCPVLFWYLSKSQFFLQICELVAPLQVRYNAMVPSAHRGILFENHRVFKFYVISENAPHFIHFH